MNKTSIALVTSVLVAAGSISGCANQNYSNTQKGAAIGTVVGAIAGKGTGDNDKSRYLWGGIVGGLAGAAIGNYMDKQEQQMREELSDTGVDVYREGDNLRLVMPANITFDTNKTTLDQSFYPVLEDVATVINEYEKTTLRIVGHTDSTGTAEYNKQLSLARAEKVKSVLNQYGVDDRRVVTSGQGEFDPIASNETAQGREQNRRVELMIVPLRETS
uniref:OmpA family protein n=1 Tax=Ningiella ruwaisensis TaxID=2364274 RepID=UPI0010A0518C|nr:OmpA family protein [Ningiella ruwaisensis]